MEMLSKFILVLGGFFLIAVLIVAAVGRGKMSGDVTVLVSIVFFLMIQLFVLFQSLRRCFAKESGHRLLAWVIVILVLPIMGPILYLSDKSATSSEV
jgi:uncharacterized membrane protein